MPSLDIEQTFISIILLSLQKIPGADADEFGNFHIIDVRFI